MSDMPVMDKTENRAFCDKLFIDYYAYICVVVSNSGVKESDVDDIVSETFKACWQSVDKLKSHTDPRLWLVKTAKYKVKHHLRDLSKQNTIMDTLKASGMAQPNRGRGALTYLSQINPKDAKIILLHYDNGMSLSEIAQIFGITESAAKMRLSRARKRLEKLLEGKNKLKTILLLCYLLIFSWNI